MRKNILIVEDKEVHRVALCKIVTSLSKDIVVYEAEDMRAAYHISMNEHIHLFLLDIILSPQMQGDTKGLDFAREIRKVKKYHFTPIIFITSLEDPKFYTYSHLHCWRYIEKPYDPQMVKETILEALEVPVEDDKERSVFFRKDGIIYAVKVKDIIYIENKRRKIIIHYKDEVLEIPYKTCEEIMKDLDSEFFVKCNRNTIINISYITQIDFQNHYIKLKCIEELIDIGISMRKNLKKQFGVTL